MAEDMAALLVRVRARFAAAPGLVALIDESQATFETFLSAHLDARMWSDVPVANYSARECECIEGIPLLELRSKQLQAWLVAASEEDACDGVLSFAGSEPGEATQTPR